MATHTPEERSAVERFAELIGPRRQAKNPVEDTEYCAMVQRMLDALEYRATENPAVLPQVLEVEKRARQIVDVAIYTNAVRYEVNPYAAASGAECGRALGITKQSASERKIRGGRIVAERIAAAGVPMLNRKTGEEEPKGRRAELERRKDIIAKADERAVTNLADYLARYAKRGQHRAA